MTEQIPANRPPTTEQILDLLLDALAERQRERGMEVLPPPAPSADPADPPAPDPSQESETPDLPAGGEPADIPEPPAKATEATEPEELDWRPPERLPSIQLARLITRLAVAMVALVIVINIPIQGHGVSLARILPDTASLIIRDGLVLKGDGDAIYMLQDDKLRWISSMDAFEHLGLSWGDVHEVDDAFLGQFAMGQPIHVIYKCEGSPHIYALENGAKRWIKDIATFTAQGYVWEDVQMVECDYLRRLPDGQPIPVDAGRPPQP